MRIFSVVSGIAKATMVVKPDNYRIANHFDVVIEMKYARHLTLTCMRNDLTLVWNKVTSDFRLVGVEYQHFKIMTCLVYINVINDNSPVDIFFCILAITSKC